MKHCFDCGQDKPFSEFWRDSRRRDGLQSYCKPCLYKRNDAARRKAGPKRTWAAGIKYRYGIDLATFETILAEQGGVCAGCGGPPVVSSGVTFHIDHDHETGAVRGLLCQNCNVAIGGARDDPEQLRRLAEYLEDPPAARVMLWPLAERGA